MRGRRDPESNWDPLLGLAILSAQRPLYERLSQEVGIPQPQIYWRSHEAIGAFMGVSRTMVQLIERRALRKLRIAFIYRRHELTEELQEALRGYEHTNIQTR